MNGTLLSDVVFLRQLWGTLKKNCMECEFSK